MMVVCISDGTGCHDESAQTPKKGYLYTVSKEIPNNLLLLKGNEDNKIWYELEETGKWLHHSSIFIKIENYDKIKQG